MAPVMKSMNRSRICKLALVCLTCLLLLYIVLFASISTKRRLIVLKKHFGKFRREDYCQGHQRDRLSEINHQMTLFTSWSSRKEKFLCYNNTLTNWASLPLSIKPLLFTNDKISPGQRTCRWKIFPIAHSVGDYPILKHMFLKAMSEFNSSFYGFANGDILFTDSLEKTLQAISISPTVKGNDTHILIIGRRINVENVSKEDTLSFNSIKYIAITRGHLMDPWGIDMFISSANYPWNDIPDVVIGKPAYDNWLVLNAKKQGHIVIDATNTILAVHQTTKSGNNEGHKKPNPYYNMNLLSKLYKTIKYHMGFITCAPYFTAINNTTKKIEVRQRTTNGC